MPQIPKAGRNDTCPCGSGKKYKRCCALKQQGTRGSRVMAFLVFAVLAGAIVAAVTSFGEDPSPVATPGRTWSPEHGHYH
jgi:hypothetical protein